MMSAEANIVLAQTINTIIKEMNWFGKAAAL